MKSLDMDLTMELTTIAPLDLGIIVVDRFVAKPLHFHDSRNGFLLLEVDDI